MIVVTGDTHGNFDTFNSNVCKLLTKDDTLIILGDFGFTWNEKTREAWKNFKHDYTVLFIDGNHENFDILNSLPRIPMFEDEVGDFGNSTYHLLRGHMYNIKGKKFFAFGGASSIDKTWRIIKEMNNNAPRTLWWEEEIPSEEEFKYAFETLKKHDYKFDYFLSHTCSPLTKKFILNGVENGFTDFIDPTENMIAKIEQTIYKNNGSCGKHYFGHFHEDKDVNGEHCLYNSFLEIK